MVFRIPRLHLFEINDQTWFPSFLREKVQAGLTRLWIVKVPFLQSASPASIVADLLLAHLGSSVRDYVFIDFCAGGGGPTPSIEQSLNGKLGTAAPENGSSPRDSYAGAAAAGTDQEPVRFVLTDLHPHISEWSDAARRSGHRVLYEPQPVDAADAPPELISLHKEGGKKLFRLYNLAFHHFDDPLAKAILKNTVETSEAFGIFELQGRDAAGLIAPALFGFFIFILAPFYAWAWRSPATLFFSYIIPVLPFVLVFDGWISALRTRTPEEIEVLLRTCGAEGADKWVVKSGSICHFWPVGYVNWIICQKK